MMHTSLFQQPPASDDRATEFKAVTANTGEQYSGYTLMVEAYAAVWLILMAWLVLLWRKQAAITARIDGLEGAILRAEQTTARGDKAGAKSTGNPAASR